MPSRKTHSSLTVITSVLLPSLFLYGTGEPMLSATLAAGILVTIPIRVFGVSIYLNPDMDIKSNTGSLARMLGIDAYEKSIRHRAGLKKGDWISLKDNPARVFTFSHVPVFGTLPRFLLCALLMFTFSSIVVPLNFGFYLWWFTGMCISDTCHVIADLVWSAVRTRKYGNGNDARNDMVPAGRRSNFSSDNMQASGLDQLD